MMKHGLLYIALCCCLATSAQPLYRYRVSLTDKQGTPGSITHPEQFLSQRAIERRARQRLPLDETDLPVSTTYLSALQAMGTKLVTTSKWNNTAVVETGDTTLAARLAALPFVAACRKVWTQPDSIAPRDANRRQQVTDHYPTPSDTLYGAAYLQTSIHHLQLLHEAGYRGQGMQIAILDGGFFNADTIGAFHHLRLLGTRDFVHPGGDLFAEALHGTMVLSCMAAHVPGVLVGTAPEASYWLLHTEDSDSEQPIEEDYYAAALEFADSAGVDMVNSSLGYAQFDDPDDNIRYRDLDGHSTLISHSASLAAAKGIVLVCSAGNSGSRQWKKITPPADADDVLTVGALTHDLQNTLFSSVGHTADGRVKPDVMAIGQGSAVIDADGTPRTANGTSFASPTLCGAVACFWQACPWLTAREVAEAVRQAGHQAGCPDNIYGYGIPDIWKAYLTHSTSPRHQP